MNHGNSGGPLIDVLTNEVIGIVTRKMTGLSRSFAQLQQALQQNVAILQAAAGGVRISGIDPIVALQSTQNQIAVISKEIERSANVGVGYAYEMDKILKNLSFFQ